MRYTFFCTRRSARVDPPKQLRVVVAHVRRAVGDGRAVRELGVEAHVDAAHDVTPAVVVGAGVDGWGPFLRKIHPDLEGHDGRVEGAEARPRSAVPHAVEWDLRPHPSVRPPKGGQCVRVQQCRQDAQQVRVVEWHGRKDGTYLLQPVHFFFDVAGEERVPITCPTTRNSRKEHSQKSRKRSGCDAPQVPRHATRRRGCMLCSCVAVTTQGPLGSWSSGRCTASARSRTAATAHGRHTLRPRAVRWRKSTYGASSES